MTRTIATIVFIAAIAVAGTASAQGRHDEKPHGTTPAATQEELKAEPKVHPGGRHDVQSHKNAITTHNNAVAKKQAAGKKAAAAKAEAANADAVKLQEPAKK